MVLLDLQLPHSSGWTLLRQIHEVSHTPIVVFIPHGTELNGLQGEGADDCLVVAFTHQELFAGVGACSAGSCRRSTGTRLCRRGGYRRF